MSFTFHAPEGSTSTLGSVTLNKTVTTECLILSTPPISHYKSTILSSKKFYACFFSLALCIIVSAFDSVVVPTTIPTLTIFFHAGSVVQLVSPVYLMSNTSLQMLYGRFSDIIGRKTSLSLAIFIFVVGTLASGFSRTLIQLLIFRAIAGAGGGKFFFSYCLQKYYLADI
jgi:MFS family permease